MKKLKSAILEYFEKDKEIAIQNISRAINHDWLNFTKNYNEKVRDAIIELCKTCGDNSKYHTYIFEPTKIKFDYNIKGGSTPGLMFCIWLGKNDEPILYIDCLDGGQPFGVSMDALANTKGLLKLRNNVLIGSDILYDLLQNGPIDRTITKEECKKLREQEVKRYSSDSGQLMDRLRSYLKKQDYDDIINELKQLVDTKGKKYRNGKSIKLKRIGRSWNNHISEIILINGELWVNVYWQGDLTDGDEEVRLSWILKDKKYVIKHRDERFTVDHDSVTDMFDDLEHFLINEK